MFGSLITQTDSAGTDPAGGAAAGEPAYLYVDYSAAPESEGLMDSFLDPSTRSSVVAYLQEVVGDPRIADALMNAAESHRVDPALVVAVSRQESRFDPQAKGVNKNGSVDRGLMQLNSSTFAYLEEAEFYDPELNARLGVGYLRNTLDLSGNTVAALAMYNAGPGRVGSLGAPRMTLDYISKILSYRDELVRGYRAAYGSGGILMSRDIRPVKDPDVL